MSIIIFLRLSYLGHFFGQVSGQSSFGLLGCLFSLHLSGSLEVLFSDLHCCLVPESSFEIVGARAGILGGDALDLAFFAGGAGVELGVVSGVSVSRADNVVLIVPLVDGSDMVLKYELKEVIFEENNC